MCDIFVSFVASLKICRSLSDEVHIPNVTTSQCTNAETLNNGKYFVNGSYIVAIWFGGLHQQLVDPVVVVITLASLKFFVSSINNDIFTLLQVCSFLGAMW